MPTVSLRLTLVLTLLVIFVLGPSVVAFYTDWLWFGEVGYQQVYATILRGQALLFLAGFAGSFLWLAVNLRLALGAMRDVRAVFTTRDGIEVTLPGRRQLKTLAHGVALVLAVIVGLLASAQWETWLTWRNAVSFGQVDPIFGRDVSFYVFSLPFYQFVRGLAQGLVVLAALGAAFVYLATGSLSWGVTGPLSMTRHARRHLSILAAIFLLLLAAGAWLQRAEYLVQSPALAQIHGASYADVYARMPARLLLVAACLIGAGLAITQALTRRNWPIPAAVGLYLLVALGGEVYGTMIQRFVVMPNQQARETPFIRHNIDATRRAFGLDSVEEREISGDARLTRDDIARNAATLENVRLWDHQPLLETFGQLQEIRTYYDFAQVDNDRYEINGTIRQVMLSPREMNTSALSNRTWINERLTFTHGYGFTLGPVNEVTSEGLPVLFVQNLPPETTGGLRVDEPSLYFGELSSDYAIVRTGNPEFHYPRGDRNEETRYAGNGGVPLDSIWRKLLFAFRFRSYPIVLSDDIGPESRILYHRRIDERVKKIAPFLTFDKDPYLVLADGRLFWLFDAYTTSSLYPYSTPTGGVNYMRNAVKFVIDAYHGTTTAYLADKDDPLARTYARIFPGLFKPLDEMPASLRRHIRYPEDIFGVQASVFATYHMTEPGLYYNREDQWEIPRIEPAVAAGSRQGESAAMQPYYTIMRLPGETEPEFIQMLPFTPRERENLAAWLAARSDGEHYGRLRLFTFPKQKTVFGPRQVVNRISQDQTIAPQITLWNQQGSQANWGTLMVIPVEESLIYVRPLYLRASNRDQQGGLRPRGIPELTRVVVAYGTQIVMERTLDEALARLFGGPTGGRAPQDEQVERRETEGSREPDSTAAANLAQLAAAARDHYARAIEAQKSGDWARYGEELRLLGEAIERMQQRPGR